MQNHKWVLEILLILSFYILIAKSGAATPACSASDRAALLGFKASIVEDTTGTLSSWVGTDCCSWEGIQCDPNNGRVTSLQVQRLHDEKASLYMKGTLSPSLGNLPFLEVLMLSGLKQIRGTIPGSYTRLPRLAVLVLEDMMLLGAIPSSLGQLSLLQVLSLSGNRFQGQLPPSLGHLTRLIEMNFGKNSLIGSIPQSFKSLQNLQYLDLSHNLLTGSVDLVGQLQNVTYLDLSQNQFSGGIPVSLCSLKKTGRIDLSQNNFSGQIPPQVGNLKSLTILSLSHNQLTGPIPASLALLSQLSSFNVSRNRISGTLPASLGRGLPKLISIDLSYNDLNLGAVPDWLRTRQLYDLHLAGCKIRGTLPNFSNPDYFNSIDLSDNQLTGAIDSYFAKMGNVQHIKLSSNMLRSDVTKLVLPYGVTLFDVHSNQLYGQLPILLNKLPSNFLKTIDLSNNQVTGAIPSSISNFTILEIMSLSRNQIHGIIPPSLGDLTGLKWLDLSINKLTGRIPDSLLGLQQLRHLNLRANSLCGQIPQGRPLNLFPGAAYAHNQCLCGKPLQACRGGSI